MKLYCCADVHLGNHKRQGGPEVAGLNARCRMGLDVLRHAVAHAKAGGGAAFLVLGDLFDDDRPSPQLLAAAQAVFRMAAPMPVVLLVGNHDQHSDQPGDHALGPLSDVATIVEKPELLSFEGYDQGIDVVALPYRSEVATEWLPKVLEGMKPEPTKGVRARLLVVHLGIADSDTPPWLKDSRDSIPVETLTDQLVEHGFDAALAGNWHNYALWQDPDMPSVGQCGALVPTGWDNPGLDELGGLFCFELPASGAPTLSATFTSGPRFVAARSPDELHALLERARLEHHSLFVEGKVDAGGTQEMLDAINEAVANKAIAGGDLRVDTAVARAEARTASHAARSAETLDEALAGFVRAMSLDDDVDRGRVLSRTCGLLKLGAA